MSKKTPSKNTPQFHPKNERIKLQYFQFLMDADGKATATIDAIRKALHRFESYNGFRDFTALHREQIIGFKKHLAEQTAVRSGKPLSKSTQHSTMNMLRAFFRWLVMQPGYRDKIDYNDVAYFTLSEKDIRIAKRTVPKAVATMEQLAIALQAMPSDTILQQRDRAVFAFTVLTAMRVTAITSIKLKHVDLVQGLVVQDASEVQTKFAKTINTALFPVPFMIDGLPVVDIIKQWIETLQRRGFTGDDPLFTRTRLSQDADDAFVGKDISKDHWQSSDTIRRIFRDAFAAVGLPYFNPHSIRNSLMNYAYEADASIEQLKALSQNFGHSSPTTTLTSYGELPVFQQIRVIQGIGQKPAREDKLDRMLALLEKA